MSLVKCRECKAEVSSIAKTCPSCGIKKPGSKRLGLWYCGIVVVMVLGVIFTGNIVNAPKKSPISITQKELQAIVKVTKDSGYICDTVSYAQIGPRYYSLMCNNDLYYYQVTQINGKWVSIYK